MSMDLVNKPCFGKFTVAVACEEHRLGDKYGKKLPKKTQKESPHLGPPPFPQRNWKFQSKDVKTVLSGQMTDTSWEQQGNPDSSTHSTSGQGTLHRADCAAPRHRWTTQSSVLRGCAHQPSSRLCP